MSRSASFAVNLTNQHGGPVTVTHLAVVGAQNLTVEWVRLGFERSAFVVHGDPSAADLAPYRSGSGMIAAGRIDGVVTALTHVTDTSRSASIEGFEITYEAGGIAYRGTALFHEVFRHGSC